MGGLTSLIFKFQLLNPSKIDKTFFLRQKFGIFREILAILGHFLGFEPVAPQGDLYLKIEGGTLPLNFCVKHDLTGFGTI